LPTNHNNFDMLITGAAGFIGGYFADELRCLGYNVHTLDKKPCNKNSVGCKHLNINLRSDMSYDDWAALRDILNKVKVVYHFAANSDVRSGETNDHIDYEENVDNTLRLIRACKNSSVEKFIFASSSSVYGNAKTQPIPEDYGPLEPISHYGASKAACEAIISAFCHNSDMQGYIYRFANVVGPDMTHGVVYDFCEQLHNNCESLHVLSNGEARKSFVHVENLFDAVHLGVMYSKDKVNTFNIGPLDNISILEVENLVRLEFNHYGISSYGPRKEGWNGDVTSFVLDCSKLISLGWNPPSSESAVKRAIRQFQEAYP
jgi:UDP-glucose 4-epimerase